MPHRILRQLLNDPRIIQQMAESWPMKKAARFSVQTFYKLTYKLESMEVHKLVPRRLTSFLNNFRSEYRKALEQKK